MTENRWLLAFLGALLLVVIAAYFPWPEATPGAHKYDVTGIVLVNGEPASGLTVRLHGKNRELMNQDRLPVGMTDSDGRFQLSSFGGNDGAAEGEYAVTFFWPTNVFEPTTDRLGGRFQNPAESKFLVVIPPEPTELPPFEITLPERELL
ncbi:MAG: hypothetical protein AAF907_14750, partial [Planctomycetota bacterium]